MKRNPVWGFVLAGLFAGLCISTKPTFLLFAPAVALAIFIRWRKRKLDLPDFFAFRDFRDNTFDFWFYIQFGFYESIAQILSFYANPFQEKNTYSVIFENLRHFVSDSGPIYLIIMLLIWSIGIILRRRRKIEISSSEIAAFSFSLLISAAILRRTAGTVLFFRRRQFLLFISPKSISLLAEFVRERLKRQIFLHFARFFLDYPSLYLLRFGNLSDNVQFIRR